MARRGCVAWNGKTAVFAGLRRFSIGRRSWIRAPVDCTRDLCDGERRRSPTDRREALEEIPGRCRRGGNCGTQYLTTTYTQVLRHSRLQWAARRLELWNREPRAHLTLRFDRISSEAPELFFVSFSMPCEGMLPRTSCGGMPFVPCQDQIPGSCRDYFSIDGWVHYEAPQGNWLWVSRDAPLATFGSPNALAQRKDAPQEPNRVLAMIFDNRWFTNFVANSHGAMEFQFDLAWKPAADSPIPAAALADALVTEPQVIITPAWKEDPIVARRLYRT